MQLYRSVAISVDDETVGDVELAYELPIDEDLDLLSDVIVKIVEKFAMSPSNEAFSMNLLNRSVNITVEVEDDLKEKLALLADTLRSLL